MEREQIIKALECLASEKDVLCKGCAYQKYEGLTCRKELAKDALTLINELTEELAEAESEAEKAISIAEGNIRAEIASGGTSCHWCEDKVKADTVRKMQERLKAEKTTAFGSQCEVVPFYVIDQIVKKMEEEK